MGATHWPRAGRIRADRHRPWPDPDPPDQHPGHQYLGEPGALHRRRRCSRAAGRSAQLWLFWLAPLIGGIIGGLIYRHLLDEHD